MIATRGSKRQHASHFWGLLFCQWFLWSHFLSVFISESWAAKSANSQTVKTQHHNVESPNGKKTIWLQNRVQKPKRRPLLLVYKTETVQGVPSGKDEKEQARSMCRAGFPGKFMFEACTGRRPGSTIICYRHTSFHDSYVSTQEHIYKNILVFLLCEPMTRTLASLSHCFVL